MNTILYHCESCDWEGVMDDMAPIDDIAERVSPGELHPAGQCPQCGALIGVDDADVPNHTLDTCASIRHRRRLDEARQQVALQSTPNADLSMFGCQRADLDALFDKPVLPEASTSYVIMSMRSDVQELMVFGRDGELPANLQRARQLLIAAKYGLVKEVAKEREQRS